MNYTVHPSATMLTYKKRFRLDPAKSLPLIYTYVASITLEISFKVKFTDHLLGSNLVSEDYHSSLKHRSCAACMTDFLNHVVMAATDVKGVIAAILGRSRAFGWVSHTYTLPGVKNKDIVDLFYYWLASYLNSHDHSANFNNPFYNPGI